MYEYALPALTFMALLDTLYDGINFLWEPGGGGNVTKCENAFQAFLRALEAPNCLEVKERIECHCRYDYCYLYHHWLPAYIIRNRSYWYIIHMWYVRDLTWWWSSSSSSSSSSSPPPPSSSPSSSSSSSTPSSRYTSTTVIRLSDISSIITLTQSSHTIFRKHIASSCQASCSIIHPDTLYITLSSFDDLTNGCFQNSGTPKSSILIGFSIINYPFWGSPIFGNTQILLTTYHRYAGIGATPGCHLTGCKDDRCAFWVPRCSQHFSGLF